jgi:hypothetical protein
MPNEPVVVKHEQGDWLSLTDVAAKAIPNACWKHCVGARLVIWDTGHVYIWRGNSVLEVYDDMDGSACGKAALHNLDGSALKADDVVKMAKLHAHV